MQKLLLIIVATITLIACDKPIDIDQIKVESKVVIEGLLTNQSGRQFVKVSTNAGFYNDGTTPRVTNAVVSVNDELGNSYLFVHNPNNAKDSSGYYLPVPSFKGEVGRTYTLNVEVNGKSYSASEKMFRVTSIDSLTYEVNDDQVEDAKEENKIYEVLLFAKEPQETKDYYLFKFYRNDSLKYDAVNDVYFSSDDFLAESIDGVPSPNFYGVGDKGRVEMYSLTRNGFVFYADLQKLVNNDGGMFGSPPANVRTNLTNGALGFFQVSALSMREIVIE